MTAELPKDEMTVVPKDEATVQNDEAGTQKFSLSRNTITFLKKSNLVTDIVHTSDISLQQMDGYVKHYLIERL